MQGLEVDCGECLRLHVATSSNKTNANGPDYLFGGTIINGVLALGTILIAIFAVVQGLAAKRTAQAIDKQIVLEQRPRIVVRNLYFHDVRSTGPPVPTGVQNGSLCVSVSSTLLTMGALRPIFRK